MKRDLIYLPLIVSAIWAAHATAKAMQDGPQQIEPRKIEAGFTKTVHILFPSPVTYIDIGSMDIIAGKADGAENVVRVKAAVRNFAAETNLTVITEDGGFFTFDVYYAENPAVSTVNLTVQDQQTEGVKKPDAAGDYQPTAPASESRVLLREVGREKPATVKRMLNDIYRQNRTDVKGIRTKKYGIGVEVLGIYVFNDVIYIHSCISNDTNISFEVDARRFIVADRKRLLNGNAFILGVSGSGKSFSAKKEMVSLALSTDDDIIIIDPESEYRPLVEGLGGQVINISATSPNHINAMDMEQGYGDGENPVVLKSEFLLSLCEQLIGAGKLSAKEKSIIDRCTAQVYREYIRGGYQGQAPTLQDFHAELLRQPEKEATDVALAIELFTEGSLNTFAKPTNVDTNARILCYDIRDLGKQLLPVGMLVVLDSIFNRIIRNRGLKRNTWIYIDEIYLLFQHEYSANFLFTLWKRMRKYQACGTGISQNIEDLLQSHTARTMLANSEFLIMLNQAATDREELAHLLNISDNQLSYITNVDSGRGLIKCGSAIVPFVDHFPKNKLYRLMTTKPSDLAA